MYTILLKALGFKKTKNKNLHAHLWSPESVRYYIVFESNIKKKMYIILLKALGFPKQPPHPQKTKTKQTCMSPESETILFLLCGINQSAAT